MKRAICFVVLALLVFATPFIGASQERANSDQDRLIQDEFAARHSDLLGAVRSGEISLPRYKKIRQFTVDHPELSRAFERDRFSYTEFRNILIAIRDNEKEVLGWLEQLEQNTLKDEELAKRMDERQPGSRGEVRPQDADPGCGRCSTLADGYYHGCLYELGDVWYCFIRTEQYQCVCENDCRVYRDRQDCGILV